MKVIRTFCLIGSVATLGMAEAEDFPQLSKVQGALNSVELSLVQRKAEQELLVFQRLRYFVLTNDQALRVESLEFNFAVPSFKEMVAGFTSGFVTVLKTLDYAEGRLVEERANVALEAFEKFRFYAMTDQSVVHAEDTSQLQMRMEAFRKSVDSGQFQKVLETPNLSFMLLAHLRGETIPQIHNLPWPLCTIWGNCED
jgi:hypothetical protein